MENQHYIGVDLHKASFQACAVDQAGARLWEASYKRTAEEITAWLTRVGSAARVAVEATGPTWKFVDRVQAAGLSVCVVDTRKTKLKAGYAAKTDKLDARRLADALRRESVVSIYIPPPALRELRDLCRGRHHLVRVRTKLIQAIRALLLRHDVADDAAKTLVTVRGLTWLRGVHLEGDAEPVLRRLERVLQVVHEEARAADVVVKARAAGDPIVTTLTQMVGIGPVLGLTIRSEIGAIERFAHGKYLASYAGLVPMVRASGGHVRTGGITREGSPWLRWALVEAANHAIKRRDRVGRWARRLTVRKGMPKARIALARVLCDEIVQVWKANA
jgi:transposase